MEKIKLAGKLKQKKYRAETGLFLAEGLRLCEVAAESSKIRFGFFTGDFSENPRAKSLIERLKKIAPLAEISPAAFSKISDTETPQGILLAVEQKKYSPSEVLKKSSVVVSDGIQDPGNVGTILRTAEAFDCGMILLEGSADIYNPKVVRSSMGAIFNLPTVQMTRKEFLSSPDFSGIEIFSTTLDKTSEIYFTRDFTKKSVFVFGNEANGISEEIAERTKKIFIPMTGKAESLNVAAAVAIIISEAARQKFC